MDKGQEKKRRERSKKQRRKQPANSVTPDQSKLPRSFDAPSSDGNHPVWSFELVDLYGQFGWMSLHPGKIEEVLAKLQNFEGMTFGELTNDKPQSLKQVDVAGFSGAAKKSLPSRSKESVITELWEFRLSGEERIFCDRLGDVMSIIFWDPNHLVYPSKLKNT